MYVIKKQYKTDKTRKDWYEMFKKLKQRKQIKKQVNKELQDLKLKQVTAIKELQKLATV